MIFTQQQVKALLAGKTVELTVKKKEGEFIEGFPVSISSYERLPKIKSVCYWGKREPQSEDDSTARRRWQVGRSYSVQLGNKPALWYCKNCNKGECEDTFSHVAGYSPLRVVLLSIKDGWKLKVKKE